MRAAASAACRWAFSAPPWKTGADTPPSTSQAALLAWKTSPSRVASWVRFADSRTSGYWAATATPTAAVAACRSASAARMSGRRRTRVDGRLTGVSAGAVSFSSSKSGAVHSAGDLPARSAIWCRAMSRSRSRGGNRAWSSASWATPPESALCASPPAASARRTMSITRWSSLTMAFTSVIWARSPAIFIACIAMLPLSVR